MTSSILTVDTHWPVAGSQILTVLSSDTEASWVANEASRVANEASRVASCDQATDLTGSLWPSSVDTHWPVAGSQILTVLSSDAEASRVASCDQATDPTELLWPSSVDTHWLVAGSQILTVLSSDAGSRILTMRLPFCDRVLFARMLP